MCSLLNPSPSRFPVAYKSNYITEPHYSQILSKLGNRASYYYDIEESYDFQFLTFPASIDPFQLRGYIAPQLAMVSCWQDHVAVVAYHLKTQPITATSSTKAESIATILLGKVACYL
jgi:hypothetical protein